MDINDIKQRLPHRYPFLLVDRVVELEEGKRILAYKNITANEEVFNGHFPNTPIFPGVMLEAQVDSVKRTIWRFKCRATVGDELACEATILCALKAV